MFSLIDAARRNGTSIADALFCSMVSENAASTAALIDRAAAGLSDEEELELLREVSEAMKLAIP